MRYKTVPAPRDLDGLYAIRDAVPLVPGSEEDCCSRIAARTTVPGRDAANEWLAFLEALGLVAEGADGFHRTRNDPELDTLAERFLENVFGAREVLEVAGGEDTIDVDDAFEALRESVPTWERHHNADWEGEWRETTRRLLAWAVVFDRLEGSGDDRYRVASDRTNGDG
jgi:hypothetical protein